MCLRGGGRGAIGACCYGNATTPSSRRQYTAASALALAPAYITPARLTAPIIIPGRTCLTPLLLTPTAGQRWRTFITSFPCFSESAPPGTSAGAGGAVDEPIKTYSYDAIKSLVTAPTRPPSPPPPTDTMILDVREPSEFAEGHIPSARNLPITTRPDGLHLSPEEFRDAFGWEKPDPSSPTELIFYCRAGVRSKTAVRIARECGYTNVAEYPGSWLDWVENEEKQKQL